jgi:hypothetical protein
LSEINKELQQKYGISITPTGIIEAMRADEIPEDMRKLIDHIDSFQAQDASE